MTSKFGVPIIQPVSSNLDADGRHQHAALVHAAARLGKHRHRGRQRDTKGRRRTASLNQPLLTQVRAAGRLGQAPQNPELGGLEKYGLRHALGCQEKKSPDQRPPERIRPVLERGPSRWRPFPGRRRDGAGAIRQSQPLEWVLTRLHRPTHKGLHTQALFHFLRPT